MRACTKLGASTQGVRPGSRKSPCPRGGPRSFRALKAAYEPPQGAPLGGFAGNRIRTYDPRITNALLYQLSYPGAGSRILSAVARAVTLTESV